MDITDTLAPKSDQLNAEDLLTSSRTVTIEKVVRKSSEEQPLDVHLTEFPGRPFRPSKTVRRILAAVWSSESDDWVGKRMTIYRDPEVKWAGEDVGGIRVSHLSGVDKRLKIVLTTKRGQKKPFYIDPLPDTPLKSAKPPTAAAIIGAFDALGVSVEQLETKVGCGQDAWTAEHVATLAALGKAIKAGETTVQDEFRTPTQEALA